MSGISQKERVTKDEALKRAEKALNRVHQTPDGETKARREALKHIRAALSEPDWAPNPQTLNSMAKGYPWDQGSEGHNSTGTAPARTNEEPKGCPTPGACSCTAALTAKEAECERLRGALKEAASAMEEVAYDLARVERSNPLFVGRLRAYAKRARAALKEKP